MASASIDPGILIFHGNDEFRVDQAVREALATHCPQAEKEGTLTVIRGDVDTVDGVAKAVRETRTAVMSLSMFGDLNVTWLRQASFLPGGNLFKFDATKEAVESLQSLLEKGLGPGQLLLISANHKILGASRFLKALKGLAGVREFSRSEKPWDAEKEDESFLREQLHQRNIRVDGAAIEAMLDRMGGGPRMVMKEVEKLDLFLGPRREVTVEDVEKIISPMREVAAFTFCAAVAEGDLNRAMFLLRQMEGQKVSPIAVIAQLHNQIRDMGLYRSALQAGQARLEQRGRSGTFVWRDPNAEAAAQVVAGNRKPSPFRQFQLAKQSQRFTPAALDQMLRLTAEAYRQQFLSGLPGFLQLELLVLRLMAPRQAGSA